MTSQTHYLEPTRGDRIFGAVVRWCADRGLNLAGARTLTVAGRVSGQPQRVPVNPLTLPGGDYLVSVRGQTQWVRNVRAAGRAELRRGRRSETVVPTEVAVADRAPIIRAYLDRWGWEVGRFLPVGVDADATEAELARVAADIPVFVLSR
ncbi:nitroreductase/quinone reductase family protein [Gordonia sp. ABSL1-1]|uniref:nitroreductase/quinone reductase family protein n=1 Tax=Gordonia sp. ABSL1-1 TaxID=3053923 RepID=UPI002573E6B3|nr:nitroreductase/quinone reductase family protein [Gordonia sp. ABSL1-1]MDL9937421.1 nitroreductase/quinone reductase family protein [Gordonia sp. ABSL1-1]